MIREIEAKTLLGHCKDPNGWFGVKYNMNLYRGCEHHCIYCDSRSECYQIADFDGELLVKVNVIELLRKELASKRVKGTVGTGAMQDPYTPSEATLNMTGQALEVIAQWRYPVHIITKSDLILKDLETLVEINKVHASVCFTITTADDALGKKVEPGAPLVSDRLRAAKVLADRGIPLPDIESVNHVQEHGQGVPPPLLLVAVPSAPELVYPCQTSPEQHEKQRQKPGIPRALVRREDLVE